MPELKHFDPEVAILAVRKAEEDAIGKVQHASAEAQRYLQDAAASIPLLKHGVGPILERAEYVYVASFTAEGWPDADNMVPCDPELRFQRTGHTIKLDPTDWFHRSETQMPRLKVDRRYRVVVAIEPIEPTP